MLSGGSMPDSLFLHVVPSLREWQAGQGTFELTPSARIVIGDDSLAEVAQEFQQAIASLRGQNLKLASGQPNAGDMFLTLAAPATRVQLGEQGYQLEITDRITVSAST